MSDSVTVTSSSGYGSRLGKSLSNVLVWIVLVFGSIGLLWWNEYRSVERTKTLNEGEKNVVEWVLSPIDKNLEDKLVHIEGKTETEGEIKDSVFWITTDQVKLSRKVETYQRKETEHTETRDKVGWGEETTTTYTYDKVWEEGLIDSSSFFEKAGHQNPSSVKYESEERVQDPVLFWDFTLTESFVSQLTNWKDLAIVQGDLLLTGDENTHISWKEIYFWKNDTLPAVGDQRVRFQFVPKGEISVVGKQHWDTIAEYRTSNNGTISLLEDGKVDAKEMFVRAHSANVMFTWIMRAFGLLLMFVGFKMIFGILVAIGKVLPFLGNIIDLWTGIVAFVLTLVLGIGTIAISWIFVRPLLGISLLILMWGAVWFFVKKKKEQKKQKDESLIHAENTGNEKK